MTYLKKITNLSLLLLLLPIVSCSPKQDIEKDLHAPVILKEYSLERQKQEQLDKKAKLERKQRKNN